MFRASTFDKLLDRATSNLRLEPDWPAIIQICDLIRQGDVPAKYALAALKKKVYHANPHVAMFGLQVLESVVKNCGSLVHDEVGTKGYMEQIRDLVKSTSHENVRNKTLELVQAWAYAFRNSAKYRAVQDTVNIMKTEGYHFPALKESDAMFSADTAPEWAEGECCHRCRVQFSMMQRKHHCRACGQVFCHQCSSKTSTLPKFGIEKEVRVCEACYEKFNKPVPASSASKQDSDLPPEYLSSSLAQQTQTPPRKTEEELREEEEFQLALALSKSEAEEKEKEKLRATSSILSAASRVKQQHSSPTIVPQDPAQDHGPPDSELARYLDRSYWEQRQELGGSPVQVREPSAPTTTAAVSSPLLLSPKKQNGSEATTEMDDFVTALKSQVEIFVNRMNSNSSRGRSIANDSSVQTLFMNITSMHSQLLRYIQATDDRRVYFEGLQDKLAQVRDARAALDALREEHQEKLRRQAEEQERIRQIQMAQKLDMMRKKKQEYLQYQRQLALQRIQEQEREMQIRQEQQKHHYLMGNMATNYPYIQGAMPAMAQPGPQPGNYVPPNVESAPGQYAPMQYPQPGQFPGPVIQYPDFQHSFMSQGHQGPPNLPLGAGGPAPPQQPSGMMMGPGIPTAVPPGMAQSSVPGIQPPPQGPPTSIPGVHPTPGMHGGPVPMQMSPPGQQPSPAQIPGQMQHMGQMPPQSPMMHQQHFQPLPNMMPPPQQMPEQQVAPNQPQTAELISFD